MLGRMTILETRLFIIAITPAVTEEFFKRSVITNFIYRNKHYNEKLDGIVYAVFSSLGLQQ